MLESQPPVGLGQLRHSKQSARVTAHGAPLPLTNAILTRHVLADGSKVSAVVSYSGSSNLTDERLGVISVETTHTHTFGSTPAEVFLDSMRRAGVSLSDLRRYGLFTRE